MQTLSIVIPALNEEKGIPQVLRELEALSRRLKEGPSPIQTEVIVVDDGSDDQTGKVASRFSGVSVIRNDKRRGYGAAIKTGFQAARGDLLGFLDADGTYPGKMFEDLLKELREKKADLVVGSRFGASQDGMPFRRKIGNIFFARLVSWLTDRQIADSASGMRVLTRRALEALEPLPDGLDYTPAMTARALHEQLTVIECPIAYHERVGESKLSVIQDGFRFLGTILSIARLYNPLKFFGTVGFLFLVVGGLLSAGPVLHYLRFRQVPDETIYRLFTVMVLGVTGVNLISFGVFASHILSILHDRRNWQRSFWTRVFFSEKVVRRFRQIGAFLIFLAIGVNWKTIFEYVTTSHIHVHWSYLLTGASLFLVGVPLCMAGFLISVIEEVKQIFRQKGRMSL